MNYLSSELALT